MTTKEELNALKKEVETLNKKLVELTDEDLTQVAGGNLNEGPFVRGDWVDSEQFPKTNNSYSYAYQVTELNGEYLSVQEYFFPPHVNTYMIGRMLSSIPSSSCWRVNKPNWI